jgi:hypothetical protein
MDPGTRIRPPHPHRPTGEISSAATIAAITISAAARRRCDRRGGTRLDRDPRARDVGLSHHAR